MVFDINVLKLYCFLTYEIFLQWTLCNLLNGKRRKSTTWCKWVLCYFSTPQRWVVPPSMQHFPIPRYKVIMVHHCSVKTLILARSLPTWRVSSRQLWGKMCSLVGVDIKRKIVYEATMEQGRRQQEKIFWKNFLCRVVCEKKLLKNTFAPSCKKT